MKTTKGEIETTDYYGEWEAIKGFKELPKRVIVRWPNGKKEKCDVEPKIGHGSAQVDMNNYPDHFQTRKLYVLVDVNGKPTLIPLKDLRFEIP